MTVTETVRGWWTVRWKLLTAAFSVTLNTTAVTIICKTITEPLPNETWTVLMLLAVVRMPTNLATLYSPSTVTVEVRALCRGLELVGRLLRRVRLLGLLVLDYVCV